MKFLVFSLLLVFANAKFIPTTKNVGMSTLNYADPDERRNPGALPFSVAIDNAGPMSLRFPGGLEASSYLWATAPFWTPETHKPAFNTTARWPNSDNTIISNGSFVNALNFDQFMDVAGDRDVSIVVNFDSMYTDDGPSKETLIETARQWVQYARENFNNTFYWEIGNESDLKKVAYNGSPDNGAQYGTDFIDFANAMREEDPDAIIGSNGMLPEFITDVLNVAGEHIDFVAIHHFPLRKIDNRYEDFINGKGNFDTMYNHFYDALNLADISAEKKRDIFAMVTETSVVDWAVFKAGGPVQHNDVGSMIMIFDIIGRFLEKPKVLGPLLCWGTHWVTHDENTEIFSFFNQENNFAPTAYAVHLWSSMGDIVSLTRENVTGVITYNVETTDGSYVLVANLLDSDVDMDASISFHGENVLSNVVITSTNVTMLPKYSISLL